MHADEDSLPNSPPSLKSKLKNSLLFSCCFRRHHHNHRQVLGSPLPLPQVVASSSSTPSDDRPRLIWLDNSKATHDFKEEIKDKCMTIFSRSGIVKHRRYPSAEFRYDPLSYSLNFEDGFDGDDEAPLRNFSSRLPPSPPVKPVSVREITAIS